MGHRERPKFEEPDFQSAMDQDRIKRKLQDSFPADAEGSAANQGTSDASAPAAAGWQRFLRHPPAPTDDGGAASMSSGEKPRAFKGEVEVKRVPLENAEGADPMARSDLTEMWLPGDDEPFAAES